MNELSDDSELEVARKSHWGGLVPTYHIIVTMLEHDLHHAGEINRTHALLQDDDAWFVPILPLSELTVTHDTVNLALRA